MARRGITSSQIETFRALSAIAARFAEAMREQLAQELAGQNAD